MNNRVATTIAVKLGSILVGYLSHYRDGKNIFVFDEAYIEQGSNRPTLSLSFNILSDEALTLKKLNKVYVAHHALPIFFSNLLPEGSMKELVLHYLRILPHEEFELLWALHDDMPGNIEFELTAHPNNVSFPKRSKKQKNNNQSTSSTLHFSLAGVQIKFSMLKQNNQFTLPRGHNAGNYIIKTPSILHKRLPENEYSMMKLAEAVGIEVPDVKLVPLHALHELPKLNLPNEQYAYAIRRFDRDENNNRIHIEDFAQVFGVREKVKYLASNYDSMLRIILELFKNTNKNVEQFIKRLVVNILIGNTDAHLKNWSVIYRDGKNPELSPAYDLISSLAYISNREAGLNMGKVKAFYQINQAVFERFAERTMVEKKRVLKIVKETVEQANEAWPALIKLLPVPEEVILALKTHWKQLDDFITIR